MAKDALTKRIKEFYENRTKTLLPRRTNALKSFMKIELKHFFQEEHIQSLDSTVAVSKITLKVLKNLLIMV